MNRATVFVHYDKDDFVDDYVYYFLKELRLNSSFLLFVSTANLKKNDMIRLKEICEKVLVRKNIGYDFMSYKVGLESFNYKEFDEVVVCNDSVYGPIYPLKNIFDEMKTVKCDFWGMTDHNAFSYHLQSYFLVFNKSLLNSLFFHDFWKQVKILQNKSDIIKLYEVGLTDFFVSNGFVPESYVKNKVSFKQKLLFLFPKCSPMNVLIKLSDLFFTKKKLGEIGKINITHYFWKDLIVKHGMPFIKIELFRDNPLYIDIDDADVVIKKLSTDYPVDLMKNHLQRVRR